MSKSKLELFCEHETPVQMTLPECFSTLPTHEVCGRLSLCVFWLLYIFFASNSFKGYALKMNIYQIYSPSQICETSQGILVWLIRKDWNNKTSKLNKNKIQMKPVYKVLSSSQDCLIDLKMSLMTPWRNEYSLAWKMLKVTEGDMQ